MPLGYQSLLVRKLCVFAVTYPARCGSASHCDDETCDETAHKVCDEVPAGVEVASDVGVGEIQDGEEFDDLIESAETHSSEGGKGDGAEGGVEFTTETIVNVCAERFPADPGGESEAVGVDEVIVFQAVLNEPPGVEDGVFSFLRQLDEPACEVSGSPDGEAPEEAFREADLLVHEGNDDCEDDEEGNVEAEKPPIFLCDGSAERGD